ncbi:MAG: sigma 54-interacting transcriptional regulator, partial [Myxococcales bacterium]|nr:sigma 54-interacting transcriptional regulator [Myxococcales bacterium]
MVKGFDEGTEHLVLPRPAQPIVTALWEGGMVSHPITSDSIVVGRAADANVVIDHRSVSRRHALLRLGARLTVEDLGSANGTRVRGHTIAPGESVVVEWGEPIEVGSTVVIVRAGEAASASPPRPASAMAKAESLIELVAPTDISVLITGETGVGKGYLARMVHEKSKRQSGPWLRLNCAALPEPLLESELFGHERGSFTGAHQAKPGLLESASGGTVFLDEVGDLPMAT